MPVAVPSYTRSLRWNVTRSSGLAKTILQGTVQGGRRRGRQRKRWEDNIKEWTGLEWNIILEWSGLEWNIILEWSGLEWNIILRRETKRQTEETMGRQDERVDWP